MKREISTNQTTTINKTNKVVSVSKCVKFKTLTYSCQKIWVSKSNLLDNFGLEAKLQKIEELQNC